MSELMIWYKEEEGPPQRVQSEVQPLGQHADNPTAARRARIPDVLPSPSEFRAARNRQINSLALAPLAPRADVETEVAITPGPETARLAAYESFVSLRFEDSEAQVAEETDVEPMSPPGGPHALHAPSHASGRGAHAGLEHGGGGSSSSTGGGYASSAHSSASGAPSIRLGLPPVARVVPGRSSSSRGLLKASSSARALLVASRSSRALQPSSLQGGQGGLTPQLPASRLGGNPVHRTSAPGASPHGPQSDRSAQQQAPFPGAILSPAPARASDVSRGQSRLAARMSEASGDGTLVGGDRPASRASSNSRPSSQSGRGGRGWPQGTMSSCYSDSEGSGSERSDSNRRSCETYSSDSYSDEDRADASGEGSDPSPSLTLDNSMLTIHANAATARPNPTPDFQLQGYGVAGTLRAPAPAGAQLAAVAAPDLEPGQEAAQQLDQQRGQESPHVLYTRLAQQQQPGGRYHSAQQDSLALPEEGGQLGQQAVEHHLPVQREAEQVGAEQAGAEQGPCGHDHEHLQSEQEHRPALLPLKSWRGYYKPQAVHHNEAELEQEASFSVGMSVVAGSTAAPAAPAPTTAAEPTLQLQGLQRGSDVLPAHPQVFGQERGSPAYLAAAAPAAAQTLSHTYSISQPTAAGPAPRKPVLPQGPTFTIAATSPAAAAAATSPPAATSPAATSPAATCLAEVTQRVASRVRFHVQPLDVSGVGASGAPTVGGLETLRSVGAPPDTMRTLGLETTRAIGHRGYSHVNAQGSNMPDIDLPVPLLDIIHQTVWKVAELFGFQTFNASTSPPPKPSAPSTAPASSAKTPRTARGTQGEHRRKSTVRHRAEAQLLTSPVARGQAASAAAEGGQQEGSKRADVAAGQTAGRTGPSAYPPAAVPAANGAHLGGGGAAAAAAGGVAGQVAAGGVAAGASAATAGGATGGGASGASAAPQKLWVPATVFVATDHISQLVRDGMLRQPWEAAHLQVSQLTCEESFIQSVFALHDNIFNSYEYGWCPLVDLVPWPVELMWHRVRLDGHSNDACHSLLCDLALYFLLWTEASNTRHMPEALWFLFWCCVHTSAYVELGSLEFEVALVDLLEPRPRHTPNASLRDWRVHCRNTHQDIIAAAEASLRSQGVQPFQLLPPAYLPPELYQQDETHDPWRREAAAIEAFIKSHPPGFPGYEGLPVGPTGPEQACCAELAAVGQGGFWCSRIVTPLFLLLSQEMEIMTEEKEDHKHRLGYDDINESFAHKTMVHATLAKLGVSESELSVNSANAALCAIAVWIGSPCSAVGSGLGVPAHGAPEWQPKAQADGRDGGGSKQPEVQQEVFEVKLRPGFVNQARLLPALAPGAVVEVAEGTRCCFVPERAAAFWSLHVVCKTFPERRTWWAVYRTFFRVFMTNLVAFHVMMAQCLSNSWEWRVLSSAVLTHAFLNALERYANWIICRHTQSALMQHHAQLYKQSLKGGTKADAYVSTPTPAPSPADAADGQGVEGGAAPAARLAPEDFRFVRLRRFAFPYEGAPLWGVFGFLEWVLLFLGLTALYILQALPPKHWALPLHRPPMEAWDLAAMVYCWIALFHLIGTTRPGYCVSLSHSLGLPKVFRASSCRPDPSCWVAGSLDVPLGSWAWQVLMWGSIWGVKLAFEYFLVAMPLSRELHSILATSICAPSRSGYCLELSWLLAIVTMAPFVTLVLVDGMIFYHAYLTLVKVAASILRLNYAAQPSWAQCVKDFDRSPDGWWRKCMSLWGRESAQATWKHRSLVTELSRDRAVNSAFAHAWDALIADLREGDLLTDAERQHCSYMRLAEQGSAWSQWPEAAQHVSPLIRPAFFYAGQAQKVVDTGSVGAVQVAVLQQLRSLALLLAVELQLLTGQQANAIQAAEFQASGVRVDLRSRARLLSVAVDMVRTFKTVQQGKCKTKDAAAALSKHMDKFMLDLEKEFLQPGSKAKKGFLDLERASQQGGDLHDNALAWKVMCEMHQTMKQTDTFARRLELLAPPPAASLRSSVTGTLGNGHRGAAQRTPRRSSVRTAGSELGRQIVDVLSSILSTNAEATCPRSAEARRIISVFLNSLSLDSLGRAPAILESRSLTTLTPLYNEDVIYALGDLVSTHGVYQGEGKTLSLLGFLKGVYASDFDNFRERVFQLAKRHAESPDTPHIKGLRSLLKHGWQAIGDDDFAPGRPLHTWALELQLWASMRAQVLARTARGMMCYERALRVLCEIEYPRPNVLPPKLYDQHIKRIAHTKYTYLVAAQNFGAQRRAPEGSKDRWLADSMELLLRRHEAMRVAYLDNADRATRRGQSSVLIRWNPGARSSSAAQPGAGGYLEELYRVQLPFNPGWGPTNPGRGVVVGEGKPENQNHAMVFAFSESLQTIDMNQDGCLAEALKMRNLLAELSPVTYGALLSAAASAVPQPTVVRRHISRLGSMASTTGPSVTTKPSHFAHLGMSGMAKGGTLLGVLNAQPHLMQTTFNPIYGVSSSSNVQTDDHQQHPDLTTGHRPGSLIQAEGFGRPSLGMQTVGDGVVNGGGSGGAGGLARGIAGPIAEGRIESMTPRHAHTGLTTPGSDVDGQDGEGLHNHGANAWSPGAVELPMLSVVGRLIALSSARNAAPQPTVICGFKEFPLSGQAGALASFAASTEYAFATVVQNDMAMGNVRLHYGHPDVFDKLRVMTRGGVSKATRGLHVSEDVLGGLNHTLRGGRIKYTDAVSCGKGRDTGFNSILGFETKVSCGNGEVFLSRDMMRLALRMDLLRLLHFYHSGLGYFTTARLMMLGIYLQAFSLTLVGLSGYGLVNSNLQLLIQIGLVSSLPYAAQTIFERGLVHAGIEFFKQLLSGMVPFSFFRMQTTAHYFSNDVTSGGATYIATGRGFAYSPTSWVKLYASYGRSHLHLGFEIGLLGVVLAATDAAGARYGQQTWGIWLVAASLVFAPCWFNPLMFNLDEVQANWRAWQAWLRGEVDPDLKKSWSAWNRDLLERTRDDDGRQEGHWMAVVMGLMLNSVPHLLMAFVAAHRMTSATTPYMLLSLLLSVSLVLVLVLQSWLPRAPRIEPEIDPERIIAGSNEKRRIRRTRRSLAQVLSASWGRAATSGRKHWMLLARRVGEPLLMMVAWGMPIAFIVAMAIYSDVGTFFLSLYVQLCVALGLHGAALHLCSSRSVLGRAVDTGFWLLDSISGTLLLGVVAVLSIGGIFEKVQVVLLFDRKVAASIEDSATARMFSQMVLKQQDEEEEGETKRLVPRG